MSNGQRYYGKFRGRVLNNVDPLNQGRLQVTVPDLGGPGPLTWAMPCVPLAGPNMGFLALPVVGAGVWVEFEQGDIDHPVWTGCFWGPGELPALSATVPPATAAITMQTLLQNGIVISDVPGPAGGIRIQTATGAMIAVTDAGIVISNGKGATINLTGPTVSVNAGALAVT